MDKATLRKKTWVATALTKVGRLSAWRYLQALDDVIKARENYRGKETEYFARMHKEHWNSDRYADNDFRHPSENKAIRFMDDLGKAAPFMQPATDRLKAMFEEGTRDKVRRGYERQLKYDNRMSREWMAKGQAVLEQASELFEADADFRVAFEDTLAIDLGTPADDPVLLTKSIPKVKKLVNQLADAPDDSAATEATVKAAEETAAELHAPKPPLAPEPTNQLNDEMPTLLAQLLAEREAAKAARERELQTKTLEDGMRGIAHLYALFGGNQRTASQMVQLIDISSKLREAVSVYQESASLSPRMAALALTGNWIVAAVSIASLFAPSEPDPLGSAIMDSLKQISDQLVDIHKQLNNGFSYLDTRLVNLSIALEQGFTEVLHWEVINYDEIHRLATTASNLASAFYSNVTIVNRKLDYLIDRTEYKPVESVLVYGRNLGSPLPNEKLTEGVAAISIFVEATKHEALTGPSLDNFVHALDYLCSPASSDLFTSYNTYRSLFGITGARKPNPLALETAVQNLLELQALSGPDAEIKETVFAKLRAEAHQIVAEADELRQSDQFLATLNALLDAHRRSVAECIGQFDEIQRSVLSSLKSAYKKLPPLSDLSSRADRAGVPSKDILAFTREKLPEHLYLILGGDTPVKRLDGLPDQFFSVDRIRSGDVWRPLRRSIEDPSDWPPLPADRIRWDSFVHRLAFDLSMLGSGSLSYGYVAGFLGMQQAEPYHQVISGYPWIAAEALFEMDGKNWVVEHQYCHDKQVKQVYLPPHISFDARRPYLYPLRESIAEETFPYILTEEAKFVDAPVERMQTVLQERYAECSLQIQNRIDEDVANPASRLSSALRDLDGVIKVLQTCLAWLLPATLSNNPAVIDMLFGVIQPIFDEANDQGREGSANPRAVPLLTKDSLLAVTRHCLTAEEGLKRLHVLKDGQAYDLFLQTVSEILMDPGLPPALPDVRVSLAMLDAFLKREQTGQIPPLGD